MRALRNAAWLALLALVALQLVAGVGAASVGSASRARARDRPRAAPVVGQPTLVITKPW
jgi:hypothetical protein